MYLIYDLLLSGIKFRLAKEKRVAKNYIKWFRHLRMIKKQ